MGGVTLGKATKEFVRMADYSYDYYNTMNVDGWPDYNYHAEVKKDDLPGNKTRSGEYDETAGEDDNGDGETIYGNEGC